VLARVFRVGGDAKSGEVRRRLWALAERLVVDGGGAGAGTPSQLNQGLMELGAVLCTPRRPACLACPVENSCAARRSGDAERFPEKGRPQKITRLRSVSLALLRDGRVLLARRPPEGLWGGLFELPSGEPLPGETLIGAARRIAAERAGLDVDAAGIAPLPGGEFEHVLSHRRIAFHGMIARAPRGAVRRRFYDAHRWVAPAAAASLGIARPTSRLLALLDDEHGRTPRA
jgi:A/G-specific adenine glycosylase